MYFYIYTAWQVSLVKNLIVNTSVCCTLDSTAGSSKKNLVLVNCDYSEVEVMLKFILKPRCVL